MDTKSKKYKEHKQHSKFISFCLNRRLRTVVFIVSCILVMIVSYSGISLVYLDDQKKDYYDAQYDLYTDYNEDDMIQNYINSDGFQHSRLEFYEGLCIVSSFYLRNLDSSGKFQLSDNTLNDFVSKMKNTYNISINIDDNGDVSADSNLWDFYVAFGDKHLENINDYPKRDENFLSQSLSSGYKYFSARSKNQINTNIKLKSDNNYYSNENYTYYNDVLYDYYGEEDPDDNLLPIGTSGYDNLGRFIFQYYGDESVVFYDSNKKDKVFKSISDYSIRNGEMTFKINSKINNDLNYIETNDGIRISGYKFNPYNDEKITLFFAPKKTVLTSIYNQYYQSRKTIKFALPIFIISVSLLLTSIIYLAVVCGYDTKSKWRYTIILGRLPSDVLIVFLAIAFILFSALDYLVYTKIKNNIMDNRFFILVLVYIIFYVIFMGISLAIISKFKTSSFIKDSLAYKALLRLKNFCKKHIINTALFAVYNQKNIGQKLYTITWFFIAATLISVIIAIVSVLIGAPIVLLLALGIYLIYTIWFIVSLFKGFSDVNKLSSLINNISKNEPVVNDLDEYSLAYIDAERLSNISESIKDTVEKQVQSEKMKIELVTNVSHDLKTPLTSIIGYIDLLKDEDMSPVAKDYVKILENKSEKLKNIVMDVFSLAKATSGIDVDMEEIDGVILLNQVLGDNKDRIDNSYKTIITDILCDKANITADGNKLYRVIQNLIDNALNYSLDGTRIFITLKCVDCNMELTVKNTASYQMDFTPDEITERFTRGDKSRTDGGNGLGLSIAKTFTEACGGTFKVDIDGDVFKAIMTMPLRKETTLISTN